MYIRKESYDTAWLKAERDLAISNYKTNAKDDISSIDNNSSILNEKILKQIKKDSDSTKLEDYQPGITKEQMLEALHIVTKAKPDSKKQS